MSQNMYFLIGAILVGIADGVVLVTYSRKAFANEYFDWEDYLVLLAGGFLVSLLVLLVWPVALVAGCVAGATYLTVKKLEEKKAIITPAPDPDVKAAEQEVEESLK